VTVKIERNIEISFKIDKYEVLIYGNTVKKVSYEYKEADGVRMFQFLLSKPAEFMELVDAILKQYAPQIAKEIFEKATEND